MYSDYDYYEKSCKACHQGDVTGYYDCYTCTSHWKASKVLDDAVANFPTTGSSDVYWKLKAFADDVYYSTPKPWVDFNYGQEVPEIKIEPIPVLKPAPKPVKKKKVTPSLTGEHPRKISW